MRMKLSVMLALLGLTTCAVVAACKSTGPQEAIAREESSPGPLVKYSCGKTPTNPLPIVVTLDCCQFVSNADLCVPPNTQVTFTTSCAQGVEVRFANMVQFKSDGGSAPVSPFKGDNPTPTNEVPPGDAGIALTTGDNQGGERYTMTAVPVPSDAGTKCSIGNDSMSGSLDVATSGPKPGDEPLPH